MKKKLDLKNEKTVFFDIDSTLVKLSTTGELSLSLYGVKGQYKVFKKNVVQITTHLARGWEVFCWSNNGPGWVKTVLKALKIDPKTVHILNKPMKIFDDEDASVWMPSPVHLHKDEI